MRDNGDCGSKDWSALVRCMHDDSAMPVALGVHTHLQKVLHALRGVLAAVDEDADADLGPVEAALGEPRQIGGHTMQCTAQLVAVLVVARDSDEQPDLTPRLYRTQLLDKVDGADVCQGTVIDGPAWLGCERTGMRRMVAQPWRINRGWP